MDDKFILFLFLSSCCLCFLFTFLKCSLFWIPHKCMAWNIIWRTVNSAVFVCMKGLDWVRWELLLWAFLVWLMPSPPELLFWRSTLDFSFRITAFFSLCVYVAAIRWSVKVIFKAFLSPWGDSAGLIWSFSVLSPGSAPVYWALMWLVEKLVVPKDC